jgi:hypothetical protein
MYNEGITISVTKINAMKVYGGGNDGGDWCTDESFRPKYETSYYILNII